jgi:hypothetical protein
MNTLVFLIGVFSTVALVQMNIAVIWCLTSNLEMGWVHKFLSNYMIHLLWSYNCYLCQCHLIICQAITPSTDWMWYDSSYQGSTCEWRMWVNWQLKYSVLKIFPAWVMSSWPLWPSFSVGHYFMSIPPCADMGDP